MTKEQTNNDFKLNDNKAYFIYTCTLIAFFVASFFPENRIWGFNNYAYLPDLWKYSLFLFFLIIPVLITFFLNRKLSTEHKKELSERSFYIISGLITASFGVLFYFFRATTHFLGDGYQIISLLGNADHHIKYVEMGEAWAHLLVRDLLGEVSRATALQSYQVLSIISGMLFLFVTIYFSKQYFIDRSKQLFFLLGLTSGGYMLLFFGYVENYSLFIVSVLAFTLAGLLIVEKKMPKPAIVPLLAIAIFMHVMGTTLIPAAIYILWYDTIVFKKLKSISVSIKAISGILIFVLLTLLYNYFSHKYLFLRFATLPFFEDIYTVEGYTLLSKNHLLDILNLLFILIPALPFTLFLSYLTKRYWVDKSEISFLILMALSTFGAVLIFDPKLGMPRDWDLFSFSGIPIMVLTLLIVLKNFELQKSRLFIILIVSLNIYMFIPRLYCQVSPLDGIAQVENYFKLDKTKNRPGYAVLINYCLDNGLHDKAESTREFLDKNYPEIEMNKKAKALLDEKKLREAIDLYEQIMKINPMYSDVYNNLGNCYLVTGKFDTAIALFNISLGLNPNRANFLYNLGSAYFRSDDINNAEEVWLKAAKLDKTRHEPLIGLAGLYKRKGELDKWFEYLIKTSEIEKAPYYIYVDLGYIYINNGDIKKAGTYFKKAKEKGFDINQLGSLLSKYPKLNSYIVN